MTDPGELLRATATLVQAGVAEGDVSMLFAQQAERPSRALIVMRLPAAPRPGDRIRVKGQAIEDQSLRVVACVPCVSRPGCWAIVGDPVEAGSADDIVLTHKVLDRPRGQG